MLSCRKGQWVCCGERWRLMERDGETPLLTLLQQSLGDCSLLNTNGLWQINTSLPRLPNDIKVNTCNISHNPFPSALPGLDPTAIPIFSRLALTLPILRLALLFTGFPCQPGLRISFLPSWLWAHVFYRLSRVQVKYQSQNVSTDWLFHIHSLPPHHGAALDTNLRKCLLMYAPYTMQCQRIETQKTAHFEIILTQYKLEIPNLQIFRQVVLPNSVNAKWIWYPLVKLVCWLSTLDAFNPVRANFFLPFNHAVSMMYI